MVQSFGFVGVLGHQRSRAQKGQGMKQVVAHRRFEDGHHLQRQDGAQNMTAKGAHSHPDGPEYPRPEDPDLAQCPCLERDVWKKLRGTRLPAAPLYGKLATKNLPGFMRFQPIKTFVCLT